MVVNRLKQIRDELKNSAVAYDSAFKNTALVAARELSDRDIQINKEGSLANTTRAIYEDSNSGLNSNLTKEYFIRQYGSLKSAKLAYQKIYGEQKYGRSWSDFLIVAEQLNTPKLKEQNLEDRITKIENFLKQLGYQP